MREMDAFEQAYKNGYEAGMRDAEAKIVRCRECKNRANSKCPLVWAGLIAKWQGENFWCAYGERRADNG